MNTNRTLFVCDQCGAGSALIATPAESGVYKCPVCNDGHLVLHPIYKLQEAVTNRDLLVRYGKIYRPVLPRPERWN